MDEFQGAKIALVYNDQVLMILRDNKPEISFPNMWDMPGGGRENNETYEQCLVREIKEELSLNLPAKSFIWHQKFPSIIYPGKLSYFVVAIIHSNDLKNIVLHEGQKWQLIPINEFFKRDDIIPALKERLRVYLESK